MPKTSLPPSAAKAAAIRHIQHVAALTADGLGYETSYADGRIGAKVTTGGLFQVLHYEADDYIDLSEGPASLSWSEIGALLDICTRCGHPY